MMVEVTTGYGNVRVVVGGCVDFMTFGIFFQKERAGKECICWKTLPEGRAMRNVFESEEKTKKERDGTDRQERASDFIRAFDDDGKRCFRRENMRGVRTMTTRSMVSKGGSAAKGRRTSVEERRGEEDRDEKPFGDDGQARIEKSRRSKVHGDRLGVMRRSRANL